MCIRDRATTTLHTQAQFMTFSGWPDEDITIGLGVKVCPLHTYRSSRPPSVLPYSLGNCHGEWQFLGVQWSGGCKSAHVFESVT
eukprot:539512-Pyramimonas_sp.AAC.1